MNDTTEKIGRIALFASLASGNQHPTLTTDLVTLDESGRAPVDAHGHRLITGRDAPIAIYVHASLDDCVPIPIPALLQELQLTIDDRDKFPMHRDEREQATADAVSKLLEQATEAKIEWQHLHDELKHALRAREHIIEQAREWKAAYFNAFANADAVSRTLEYREQRAHDAQQAAQRRENALDDRERAIVKREERAARSVQQAVNRSNHSNELVTEARAERDAARSAYSDSVAVNEKLRARADKIIGSAREWKRRALAAESELGNAPARITVQNIFSGDATEITSALGRMLEHYPAKPEPATEQSDELDSYRERAEAWESVYAHPALREFTERDGTAIDHVMNGITTLAERAQTEREENDHIIDAIAAEIAPDKTSPDLVSAARRLRNRSERNRAHNRSLIASIAAVRAHFGLATEEDLLDGLQRRFDARETVMQRHATIEADRGVSDLRQQIADRDHVIGLRDADIDELKHRLEIEQAIADSAKSNLEQERHDHTITRAKLGELTRTGTSVSENVRAFLPRGSRGNTARQWLHLLESALRTASKPNVERRSEFIRTAIRPEALNVTTTLTPAPPSEPVHGLRVTEQ